MHYDKKPRQRILCRGFLYYHYRTRVIVYNCVRMLSAI